MIIAITGQRGVGKDTAADYLVRKYGIAKISLADSLKRALKDIFMFEDNQLNGKEKDEIDKRYGVTPRKIMQVFGSELMQFDIYKYIPELKIPKRQLWINRFKLLFEMTKNRTKQDPDVVVPDVRFLHESKVLKEMGATIVKINRNTGNNDDHISETELNKIVPDYVIENNGSLEELYSQIDYLVGKIYGKKFND